MKKLVALILLLSTLAACASLPRRRKRTREELTRDHLKKFEDDGTRIRGKNRPDKLF